MTDDHALNGLSWVIGAGGLLGRSVVSRSTFDGHDVFVSGPIPWDDRQEAVASLGRELDRFILEANGRPWAIYWCAGAAVSSTSRQILDEELATFQAFLATLSSSIERDVARRGRIVLASSAAVYAGSLLPPFDEDTTPVPVNAYGETKLAMEKALSATVHAVGLTCVIARIANLYGPGQNLSKAQGLISQLAHARSSGSTLEIYADLGTLRDYIYVDDCAGILVRSVWGDSRLAVAEGSTVVKVAASGIAHSLQDVLDEFERITAELPPVTLSPQPAESQILDLRLASRVGSPLRETTTTSLAEGMSTILRSDPESSDTATHRDHRSSGFVTRWFRWGIGNEKVRYLFVGGFNVLAWTGWFVLFELLWGAYIGYIGSLAAAYVLSNISGFFLHRYVVFKVRGKFGLDLARFTLVQVGSFLVNTALLTLFVEVFRFPTIPAQAVVVFIMVTANFIAHKFFSFRRRH